MRGDSRQLASVAAGENPIPKIGAANHQCAFRHGPKQHRSEGLSLAGKKFLLEGEHITWWVIWSLLDISAMYTAVTYKSRERKRAGEKQKCLRLNCLRPPRPRPPPLLVE